MDNSKILEDQFEYVNELLKKIEDYESTIREAFDVHILEFFKSKGIIFCLVDNKYDPTNRYYLEKEVSSDLFALPPIIKVYHNTFTVEFNWWKTKNKHVTKVFWDPYEMSLEEFYYEKLEKTFKLI